MDSCCKQRVSCGGLVPQYTVVATVARAGVEPHGHDLRHTQAGLLYHGQLHQQSQRRGISALHHVRRRVLWLGVIKDKDPRDHVHAARSNDERPLPLRGCFEHVARVVRCKLRLCVVRAVVLPVHVLDVLQRHLAEFALDAARELVVGAQLGAHSLETWVLVTSCVRLRLKCIEV